MSTLKATNLQNASSATTNIALDTSGNVTVGNNVTVGGGITASSGTVVMSSPYTMRNKIINGAMVIDQRNAGASVTPVGGQYTLDRWNSSASQTGKYSVQQNAGGVTPPTGFTNYLGVMSLSSYSIGAGDYFIQIQYIEGFNVADLAWGTANAATVTLSFWSRSSLTGTFGGSINNSGQTRSYPFSYTISAANTWEKKTITIPGDTTGTWLTNNGSGLQVNFGMGVGSTYSGTAGAWTAGNFASATGATSVVGTNGATFYITGVQLERGTVATPFEYRNYQQELAMCQRYFQLNNLSLAYGLTSSGITFQYNPPVYLRATPTLSLTTTTPYWESVAWSTIGSLTSATVDGTHMYSSGGDIRINGTFSPAPSYGSLSLFGANFVRISAEL